MDGSNEVIAVDAVEVVREEESASLPVEVGVYDDLRKEIQELSVKLEGYFIDFGAKLYKVWKDKIYESWKFESFDDYLASDLHDWSERRGKYLVAIYKYFNDDLKDPALLEELKDMGWTKLKEILYLVNRDNKDQFVKLSALYSSREFGTAVKAIKQGLVGKKDLVSGEFDISKENFKEVIEKAKEKVAGDHFMTLSFTEEQYANVKDAIEIATKISRATANSNNLSLICLEFLTNNSDLIRKSIDEATTLELYLQRLERELGMKLVCLKDGKIIHGEDLLEKQ